MVHVLFLITLLTASEYNLEAVESYNTAQECSSVALAATLRPDDLPIGHNQTWLCKAVRTI
jgi:hypothetical protein